VIDRWERVLEDQGQVVPSVLANCYRHIEETRVHRFVVSNRDSDPSFRYLPLNELIHDAHDRVAFVRPRRVRENNLFPNTGDAAGFIKRHMPLVPTTIVKRNAVMWNSRRCFFWHWNPFTDSAGICRALPVSSAFMLARRTGIEPASPEGELRALCQS
jgi:hypothetical protein